MKRALPLLCVIILAVAFFLPVGNSTGSRARSLGLDPSQIHIEDECWTSSPFAMGCSFYWPALLLSFALAFVAFAAAVYGLWRNRTPVAIAVSLCGVASGMLAILLLLQPFIIYGTKAPGLWLFLLGHALLTWQALGLLADATSKEGYASALVAGIFGLWLVFLWQTIVVGFGVPQILLPPPSAAADELVAQAPALWADFQQTFLKAVLAGFALGSALGFAVAVLTDRVPFLQRGLLPLGNMASAVPIIGIAPIMVMMFGFDWQSKAAVIVVMTFFPMLINTIAGLAAADHMQRDLMRSYGAGYWQTLAKLRLPAALPFIFNALKINSTLALIGGIVAEFFGSHTVGLGFRINTMAGRNDFAVVWATIAVAALAGSLFYGLLALIERGLTFWHPSYRAKAHNR